MKKLLLAAVLMTTPLAAAASPATLNERELAAVTAAGGSIATKNTSPYVTAPKGAKQPVVAKGAQCQCGPGATFKPGKK
jgi:hypothetical protein